MKDVQKQRKILILSLGVGQIETDEEKKKESKCPYKTTTYRFINGNVKKGSPFVAETLIENMKPEEILIVGTVKSAWGAFYDRYHKADCAYQETWESIEKKIGQLDRYTDDDAIAKFEDKLNAWYAEDLEIIGNPKIKVCLIKYGLEDDELKWTYKKINTCLSNIIEGFDHSDEIDISFDITHSFRSLPIYNLVVIDYCRLLMQHKINISHVFYGNLDVQRENKQIAQIVDLKDIVNLLEANKGINEFLNTGNARSFLKWFDETQEIDEGNDEFIAALRRFDGAMQMNNRAALQEALEQILSCELSEDKNALLDAENTIRDKLLKEIPEIGNQGDCDEERQKSKARFQIHLAEWCLSHGQVGLAAAIAKEGLRSFLVTVYTEDASKYEDEKARLNGEAMLMERMKVESESDVFAVYSEIEPQAKLVRNTYAHNLYKTGGEKIDYTEAETTIREYIRSIWAIIQMSPEELKYTEEPKKDGKRVVVVVSKNVPDDDMVQKLLETHEVIYHLKGDFSLPEECEEAQISNLSKVIAWKLRDKLKKEKPEPTLKIVWEADVDSRVIANAYVLLKSYLIYQRISSTRMVNNEQVEVSPSCFWKVDTLKEMSKEEKNRLSSLRSEYSAEKLKVKDEIV